MISESMSKQNDDVVVANLQTSVDLSYDIYQQINDYLKIKYNDEEEIYQNRNKEIQLVFQLGLIQAKQNLSSNNSSLLHKERKPRKDVWVKLGRIAKNLLDCHSYPKINGITLKHIINQVLGDGDPRVIRDYSKTVLLYCNVEEDYIEKVVARNKLNKFGELDVSLFLSLIPKQYIATSSTSSFGDKN